MLNLVDSLEKFDELLKICNKNRVSVFKHGDLHLVFREEQGGLVASFPEQKAVDEDLELYWSSQS